MILIKSITSVHFVSFFLYVSCTDFDVGNSIDLLSHFGVVSDILPIRYEGEDENSDKFVNASFSSNVFDRNIIPSIRLTSKDDEGKTTWKMHLCRNAETLLNTLFDNYDVEMVNRTSKLFASTWKTKNLETLFGLPQYYLLNFQFSFLLIRRETYQTRVSLKNLPENATSLNSTFQQLVDSINPPETITIHPMFLKFGTHFVKSFSVGDVIFQVLVYPIETVNCFVLNDKDEVTGMYLECALSRILRHGKIRTLSNSPFMEQWLNEIYHPNSTNSVHRHLLDLKLQKTNIPIPADVYKQTNPTIIGFSLCGIYNLIFNSTKSSFVKEMILNQIEIRDFYL